MIRLLAYGITVTLTPEDARLCRVLLYWIGAAGALTAFVLGMVVA